MQFTIFLSYFSLLLSDSRLFESSLVVLFIYQFFFISDTQTIAIHYIYNSLQLILKLINNS